MGIGMPLSAAESGVADTATRNRLLFGTKTGRGHVGGLENVLVNIVVVALSAYFSITTPSKIKP